MIVQLAKLELSHFQSSDWRSAASRAAIERLVASLSRFLAPETTLSANAGEGFDFLESRPLGGACALDGLWRRLGVAPRSDRHIPYAA